MYKEYQDSYVYPAIIEKAESNYCVYFHDLPGCIATGSTVQEAVVQAKGGLALHLWGMERDGDDIPAPTALENIPVGENETLCLIDVNMFNIRSKMDNRAVKKTLTIPWYLNDMAEKQKINFSQTLQTALKERLRI